MDRESFHENFNRLNYEWKGMPQICWGPDDNERFRSGVQISRVWLGINRQPDPGLISQALPWFDFSQIWIKKWSIMMWLVVIKGSDTNQRASLHHGGQRPLSDRHWAVIWQELRLLILFLPILTCFVWFQPVYASSKFQIPPDIVKLCHVASLFGTFKEPFESKVQRHFYYVKAKMLLYFWRLMGSFWYFILCQVVLGWSRELSAISNIKNLYGHLGQGEPHQPIKKTTFSSGVNMS